MMSQPETAASKTTELDIIASPNGCLYIITPNGKFFPVENLGEGLVKLMELHYVVNSHYTKRLNSTLNFIAALFGVDGTVGILNRTQKGLLGRLESKK